MSQQITTDSSVLFHFTIKLEDGFGCRQHCAARQTGPFADGGWQPDQHLRAVPAWLARGGEQELHAGA